MIARRDKDGPVRHRASAVRCIGLACLLGDPGANPYAPTLQPSARWLAQHGLPALRTGLLLDGHAGVAAAAVAALCDLALLWCAAAPPCACSVCMHDKNWQTQDLTCERVFVGARWHAQQAARCLNAHARVVRHDHAHGMLTWL